MAEVKRRSTASAKFVAVPLGIFFASATTFLGLIASFTGYGRGLSGVAAHYLTISLGSELPLYVVLLFFSRRALALGCCSLCLINFVGAFLLKLSDYSGVSHAPSIWHILVKSFFFPGQLLSLVVAIIALYVYSQQLAIPQEQA